MHIRKQFRARPIDIEKPLPIVHHEIDSSEVLHSRSVPSLGTGMEHEEEKFTSNASQEVHLRQALSRGGKSGKGTGGKVAAITIPTPSVRTVGDYDQVYIGAFHRSSAYEQFTPSFGLADVEYDADSGDEAWLKEYNAEKTQLEMDKLEMLIDRFEKMQQQEEKKLTLQQVEKAHLSRMVGVRAPIIAAVFEFWEKKREKLSKALIVRLRKEPAPDDPSPYVAFRPREKENKKKQRRSDSFCLQKLKQLKRELETARVILDLMKERESTKREILLQERKLFLLRVKKSRIKTVDGPPVPKKYTVKKLVGSKKSKGSKGVGSLEVITPPSGPSIRLAVARAFLRSAVEHSAVVHAPPEEEEQMVCYTDGPVCDPFPPHRRNYRQYTERKSGGRAPESKDTWGHVQENGQRAWRGRVRVGRGGRVIIDRMYVNTNEEE